MVVLPMPILLNACFKDILEYQQSKSKIAVSTDISTITDPKIKESFSTRMLIPSKIKNINIKPITSLIKDFFILILQQSDTT
jgi:hypothetical protein